MLCVYTHIVDFRCLWCGLVYCVAVLVWWLCVCVWICVLLVAAVVFVVQQCFRLCVMSFDLPCACFVCSVQSRYFS